MVKEYTVYPRTLAPFYILTYNTKWVKTSWTYGSLGVYCLSEKSCPILYSNLLFKMGHFFLDRRYVPKDLTGTLTVPILLHTNNHMFKELYVPPRKSFKCRHELKTMTCLRNIQKLFSARNSFKWHHDSTNIALY